MSDRAAQFRALYKELRIADQQRFYDDRSTEYEQAHRQAIAVRNILLVIAALVGVAAQFTSGTSRGGLGVVAAALGALAGAVTAFEALIGFSQLSKLYGDAALNLAEAGIDWDAARPDELAAEFERVEKIFRSENGQWGQLVVKETIRGVAAEGGS